MDTNEELVTRLVANIIPGKDKLKEVLKSGKKLNIYFGIDPTSTHIHLGHAVPLRKLQAFADAGHNVTFLIGDFTALVGDTSDKETERPILTKEQIEENFQTYKKQAEKVLDFKKIKVRYNSEWLDKITAREFLRLFQQFSLNDFISRELIKKRLTQNGHIRLDEVTYPILQGYDSFFQDTDLQIGGTDQVFNMQAGRTLIKNLKGKESFVLETVFPLEGLDGRKMSKTWGNAIWLDDPAEEMFGKVMSLKDDLIIQYFKLATNLPLEEISEIEKELAEGKNPMLAKKTLAHQIVKELHNDEEAESAERKFESKFQEKNYDDVETTKSPVKNGEKIDAVKLVTTYGGVSNTEAKRLLESRAIDWNNEILSKTDSIEIKPGGILKIGKRKIIKFA